jgi:hypothetical protein
MVLLMLNRINPGSMSMNEIMGKMIIEAMAVSIGISVGTAQLGAGNGGGKKEKGKDEKSDYRKSKIAMATLAVCGAK